MLKTLNNCHKELSVLDFEVVARHARDGHSIYVHALLQHLTTPFSDFHIVNL